MVRKGGVGGEGEEAEGGCAQTACCVCLSVHALSLPLCCLLSLPVSIFASVGLCLCLPVPLSLSLPLSRGAGAHSGEKSHVTLPHHPKTLKPLNIKTLKP